MAGGTPNQLRDDEHYQRQQQQHEYESVPLLPGGFPLTHYRDTTTRFSREDGGSTGSNSRVSIAQLVNGSAAEAADRSMVEAAETLGTLCQPGAADAGDSHGVQFIQRVQAIPLVNSAIGMYDRTRQSSRLIRVGSNVIESGVRRMCEPITKRIDVAQLDSFACRQLDNLGYTSERQQQQQQQQAAGGSNLRKRTKDQAQADERPHPYGAGMDGIDDVDSSNGKDKHFGGRGELEAPLLPPRPHQPPQQQQQQQPANGKWRVASLVATARERALAVREDSMRRLKYCLDWVAYATALVSQHMHELRKLLSALQEASRTAFGSGEAGPAFSSSAASASEVARMGGADGAMVQRIREAAVVLGRARKEIVAAVRRAVGVVSHYAGSVLPGEARRQVRALVLGLPRRLGAADPSMMMGRDGGGGGGGGSSVGSPSVASSCNSPFASPRQGPQHGPSSASAAFAADMSPANIEATARRTLTFASESFVMLDAMHNVFANLYANAERWIGVPAEPQQQQPQHVQQQGQQQPGARMLSEPAPSDQQAGDATLAYREQRPASSASLPSVVRKPPRRLPLNMTPVAGGDAQAQAQAQTPAAAAADGASMVAIGEQMRLMDMAALRHRRTHSSSSSPSLYATAAAMDVEAAGSRPYHHSRRPSTASRSDAAGSPAAGPAAGGAARYYAGGASVGSVDPEDTVAHKRNRTREPTPTRM
ncbi:transcriptional regulator opi1 [Coemansia erecta]|uniref:Transcriptional regulator opi1 n=1 Tax=Coemansia erecta TaxID=147472 RepID=A0A9W7Y271_9FUNG|nr:transcriptional regulator opi1 [Coemansia erecta]